MPIYPVYPGSVAWQPNRYSTAKLFKQFRNINGPLGMLVSVRERPSEKKKDAFWDVRRRYQMKWLLMADVFIFYILIILVCSLLQLVLVWCPSCSGPITPLQDPQRGNPSERNQWKTHHVRYIHIIANQKKFFNWHNQYVVSLCHSTLLLKHTILYWC